MNFFFSFCGLCVFCLYANQLQASNIGKFESSKVIQHIDRARNYTNSLTDLPKEYKQVISHTLSEFSFEIKSYAFEKEIDLKEPNIPPLEKQAEERLEKAIEDTVTGLAEIVLGVSELSRFDVAGGGLLIADGMRNIRDGIKEFKEAREIQEEARRRLQEEQNYSSTNETYRSDFDFYERSNDSQVR